MFHVVSNGWDFDSCNIELLVNVDEDGTTCSYYFIEHENAIIFWLDEITTIALDIPNVCGSDHLGELSRMTLSSDG